MPFFSCKRWISIVSTVAIACCASAVPARSSSPEASDVLLFVGEGISGSGLTATTILNATYRQVGTIPIAGNSATDSKGNFYVLPVVRGYEQNYLNIYAPPYTKQTAQIDFGAYTHSIAIEQRTGAFAVTTQYSGGGPGPSYVSFFNGGRLCNVLTYPYSRGALWAGSAFDRAGVLFNVISNNTTTIGAISGGCKAKQVVVNTLPPNVYVGNRLYFTKNDDLVFQDQYTFKILTFAHPSNGKFGPPITTTVLQRVGGELQYFDCMTSDGKHLWASNVRGGAMSKFLYPQGGAPIVTVRSKGLASCLAVSPPLKP